MFCAVIIALAVTWLVLRATRIVPPTVVDGEFSMPDGPVKFHSEFFGDGYSVENSVPNRMASAEPYLKLRMRWKAAKTLDDIESISTRGSIENLRTNADALKKVIDYNQSHAGREPFMRIFLTMEAKSATEQKLYVVTSHGNVHWDEPLGINSMGVSMLRLESDGYKLDMFGDAMSLALSHGEWKQFGAPHDLKQ